MCIVLLLGCEVKDNTKHIDGELTVHYLNVGQADSILVTNNDKTMLIDTGDKDGKDVIIPYLENLNIEKIDILIFTHPHKDHIGSGVDVIENFEIGTVYMSSAVTTTKTFEKLIDKIEEKNLETIIPNIGDKISFGDCDITVLSPSKEYDDLNNNSIVIRLNYGNTSFLFMGDAEKEAEKDIIELGADINVDVLKVGHHGSITSTTKEFLNKVNPSYAVILCGEDNDYNHPNQETLDKLDSMNVKYYRTDINGTILIDSDGNNININCEFQDNNTNSNADKIDTNLKENDTEENTTYIGNKNSKVLHFESCGSLPKEKNRIYFDNRDEAINQEYKPCSQCNP